jgi:hypothetical protein
MNEIQKYLENQGLTVLPDNAQWKNRFEIESQSSNSIYIIAQRKTSDEWACSCRGWIRYRKCKHLTAISGMLQHIPKPKEISA